MIKRIIEISQGKCHLSVRLGQLVVRRDEEEPRTIPIEDIGALIIDNQATTYTHCVLTELLANNCAVVVCDDTHHPAGMLLPLAANSTQTESFGYQINAKQPVKKRLWRQIIKAKITHQALVVQDDEKAFKILTNMASNVRSGDPENIEGQASRVYWSAYMQDTIFRRDKSGQPPNNLLNYGYMVLRAAVARALVSAGLLPTLGIHHRNRYNAYCLADDIIEPFRGFVDVKVRNICQYKEDLANLDQQTKAELIEILYQDIKIGEFTGPLMVGLHRTAASLVRCFKGLQEEIDLPVF